MERIPRDTDRDLSLTFARNGRRNQSCSNMKNPGIGSLIILLSLAFTACKESRTKGSGPDNGLRYDRWNVIGPGGGGGVFRPTISPFDENFVLTHCDMTGVYVSYNGGLTWDMKNLWNVPLDFEFDPADSNTVYAATQGFLHGEDRGSGISLLLRSSDRGKTWEICYPDISGAVKAENIQSSAIRLSDLVEGAVDGNIQKVEVDQNDNKCIYLGIAPLFEFMGGYNTESPLGEICLVSTSDRGRTWNRLASLPGTRVLAVFSGADSEKLIVFTDRVCVHVNRSTGTRTIYPLPSERIIVIEGGRSSEDFLIYVQAAFSTDGKGGMFLSRDLGKSWQGINNGLLPEEAKDRLPSFRQALAVCKFRAETAYIGVNVPRQDSGGRIDHLYCIYKTVNAGNNWIPVLVSSSREGYLTNNFSGSWMEQSYDPGWGGSPIDMGVAPNNPDICYAGDNGRAYRTGDGGKTWTQVYSRNNPDGSFTSNGLDVTTCYGVHFDPFDRKHFFISYTDIGLFHTFSGGKSWYHSLEGIPRSWQNTCYDIEFDPRVRGRVWSVWANAHDLPRTKMFGSRGFSGYEGGVAVSADGGLTWEKSNEGLPENSICTDVLLDPASPENARTLFTSVFDRGVYKTEDGGKTWNIVNDGFGRNLFAWQLRQNSNGRLFVLFARGLSAGKTVDGSVFYSDNKGDSWTQLVLPEDVNGPHDLLIDPVRPDIMYISCWPRSDKGHDSKGGVIKTTDGGKSWIQVFDESIRVNSAGMDPLNPQIIYINTFQNAAYRSENSGESWQRIEGYRFKWGQRPIPDLNNPGMLYLTTYGGSVFYGPAKGIPGIPDDIINMPAGWW